MNLNQPLDPQVKAMALAIRQVESGGNYHAKGGSGEYGAYQFTPGTFSAASKKYLGRDVSIFNATPEQQNEVVYKRIADWKSKGYNPGQIASMWNAGEGEPDAYTGRFSNGAPSEGTNKYGVHYSVPNYANKVASAYQQIKGGSGNRLASYSGGGLSAFSQPTSADIAHAKLLAEHPEYANPNTRGAQATTVPDEKPNDISNPSVPGFLGNVVKSGGNFLGGLLNTALHPIKTVENLGKVAAGGAEKAYGAITGTQQHDTNTDAFGNVVHFFGQRYGGKDVGEVAKHIANTAYTDPVGFMADLAGVISGGAGLVAKGAKLAEVANAATKASEIADAANAASTVGEVGDIANATQGAFRVPTFQRPLISLSEDLSKGSAAEKAAKIADFAEKAGNTAQFLDPLSLAFKGGKRLLNIGENLGTGSLGFTTGTGAESAKALVNAGRGSTESAATARNALRGVTSEEDLVKATREGLNNLKQTASTEASQALGKIGQDTTVLSINPVRDELQSQLRKFGVTVDPQTGELDFSRSTIGDGADASKIEAMYKDIKGWGQHPGDLTAQGVDTLKRRINNYYSPNSDVRAFTTGLAKKTRDVLTNVPGYDDYAKKYGDKLDLIDNFKREFSLGSNTQHTTTLNKLVQTMRKDQGFRKELLSQMKEYGTGDLESALSGLNMKSLTPKGLSGTLTDLGLFPVALAHPTALAGLLATSPRLVGEFLLALGSGSRKLNELGEALKLGKIAGIAKKGLLPTLYNERAQGSNTNLIKDAQSVIQSSVPLVKGVVPVASALTGSVSPTP